MPRRDLIDALRWQSPRGGGRYKDQHPWSTMREAADTIETMCDALEGLLADVGNMVEHLDAHDPLTEAPSITKARAALRSAKGE